MMQMNILEAKADFTQLIRLLETKNEDSMTIMRDDKPVLKISLIKETPVSKRIGIGKGHFTIKGDFDADNQEIADMLTEGAL